jgi:PIN domain nuclease of toxin-antitoxin system
VIMLDTHVAVALYEGRTGGLSASARRAIDKDVVTISPAVLLEIELLFEIRRLREGAKVVAAGLSEDLDIRVAGERFADVASEALALGFTRDPFDRLIVAHASLSKATLVTQDTTLRYRYPKSMS